MTQAKRIGLLGSIRLEISKSNGDVLMQKRDMEQDVVTLPTQTKVIAWHLVS